MRSSEEEGKGYLWNDAEGNSDAKGCATALRTDRENWREMGTLVWGSIMLWS